MTLVRAFGVLCDVLIEMGQSICPIRAHFGWPDLARADLARQIGYVLGPARTPGGTCAGTRQADDVDEPDGGLVRRMR